jgi:hypothetical protein
VKGLELRIWGFQHRDLDSGFGVSPAGVISASLVQCSEAKWKAHMSAIAAPEAPRPPCTTRRLPSPDLAPLDSGFSV